MKVLKVDPARMDRPTTGIYVRALDVDGKPGTIDINCLDKESLHHWLRSRGGDNPWAEHVVALLLDHSEEPK